MPPSGVPQHASLRFISRTGKGTSRVAPAPGPGARAARHLFGFGGSAPEPLRGACGKEPTSVFRALRFSERASGRQVSLGVRSYFRMAEALLHLRAALKAGRRDDAMRAASIATRRRMAA